MRASRRFGVIATGAAAVIALMAGAGAQAANPHQPLKVSLSVPTSTDAHLLHSGAVSLTARASEQGTAMLTVSAVKSGAEPFLATPKRVSLDKGRNQVSLKLSRDGRELLDGCAARRVTAAATRAGQTGALDHASAAVTRTVPQCDALAKASRCETIAAPGSNCLFPWPSDHFTVPDSSSGTGLRVNLSPSSTPVNSSNVHIDPTELNRSNGFSPGVSIVTRVPGLDNPTAFQQTGAVPVTDLDQSFAPSQPIVLIDAATGQRQLIWSEIDSNATSPATTDLIIRVGQNLKEGHRYIVAMRNLKDASGNTIPAPPGFALYRDGVHTDIPAIESRRNHFESIFRKLQSAHIPRGNLYDAWDFTVASEHNIAGRMLHIRNDALAQLGDTTPGDGVMDGTPPSFTITDVKTVDEPSPSAGHEALTGSHAVQNVREVTGTIQVPCYLDQIGCPSGSKFNLDAHGVPQQIPGNTYTANFTCNIPMSAVHEATAGAGDWVVDHADRPTMYGHGLFGDASEVHTTNVRQLGTDEGMITCGADFIGMAEEDIGPEAIPALLDLSKFPALPDRLQQGFVDWIYLDRLLGEPGGFASNPAFQFGGTSVLDTTKGVYYYGNSQGGIAGGALTAINPDITRTALYVPGMNYSTLLTRSVDFSDYSAILYPAYTDETIRPLVLSMIQMEWDRGEPDGYANHMTSDPLPGTPAHHVLIDMGYGDHQVSNVTTAVEARTIGAPLRQPALDPGRAAYPGFFEDLPTLGDLSGPAADGNAFFVWDIGPKRSDGMGGTLGTDSAPTTNTAPDDSYGVDPHDTVINTSSQVRHQIAEFLKPNGKVIDPCGAAPCYAAGWTGPGP